jgi:hypothetical protein
MATNHERAQRAARRLATSLGLSPHDEALVLMMVEQECFADASQPKKSTENHCVVCGKAGPWNVELVSPTSRGIVCQMCGHVEVIADKTQYNRDRLTAACAAMQGLFLDGDRGGTPEDYAKDAVRFADALLSELAKGGGR